MRSPVFSVRVDCQLVVGVPENSIRLISDLRVGVYSRPDWNSECRSERVGGDSAVVLSVGAQEEQTDHITQTRGPENSMPAGLLR